MDFGLESGNDEVAQQLIMDWRNADLSPEDRALCEFAEKLTRTPGAMVPGDLDALRSHGFTDEQMTIATQVIGYFNYINRIADALGVDDEEGMMPNREVWHARPGRQE